MGVNMSAAYWAQWDVDDLNSWLGMNTDEDTPCDEDYDIENCTTEDDCELTPYDRDMLTWSDFL